MRRDHRRRDDEAARASHPAAHASHRVDARELDAVVLFARHLGDRVVLDLVPQPADGQSPYDAPLPFAVAVEPARPPLDGAVARQLREWTDSGAVVHVRILDDVPTPQVLVAGAGSILRFDRAA